MEPLSDDQQTAVAPGSARVLGIVLVGSAAAWLLAPPIGRVLQPEPLDIWPEVAPMVAPEPTEFARFLFAVAIPLAVAGAVVVLLRRPPRRSARLPLQALPEVVAPVVLAVVAAGWSSRAEPATFGIDPNYFATVDLVVAGFVAGPCVLVAVRRPEPLRRLLAVIGTRRTQWAARLTVVLVSACLVAPTLYLDRNLGDAPALTALHYPFTHADFAAFGNGATPLVDFTSQYSHLLPWLLHPVLAAADYGPGAFTLVCGALSFAALIALWRAIRLVVGDELRGAILALPVLALAMRTMVMEGDERASNGSVVQIMPLRYLVPLIVAWLLARHARGLTPHRPFWLFLLAALGVINNPEFGLPCFAALATALLVTQPVGREALQRVVGSAVLATTLAALFVTGALIVRAGSLPDVGRLTYFSRLFASHGFGQQPMPAVGFHWIVCVTMVAALLVGIVGAGRWLERSHAAALAFAGVFGLGAGGYYAGRSNVITMVALFPVWGLALALLALASLRWLSGPGGASRARSPVGALAVMSVLGLGLATSELLDLPAPWQQVTRLTDSSELDTPFDMEPEQRFVAQRTHQDEPVLVLHENGHLLARRSGLRNTSSIGDPGHVISSQQLDELLIDLAEAGGTRVYVGDGHLLPAYPSLEANLSARGWHAVAEEPGGHLSEWQLGDR